MKRLFNAQSDIDVMRQTLRRSVAQMNAQGQRFEHPISALSGLWGNTIYKYQKTGRFTDAPFGALFMRLYNDKGRYKNIQECYGQAEIVLRTLRARLAGLSGQWELGMADQPGHYWACARADLSQPLDPRGGRVGGKLVQAAPGQFMFVHMDPWKNEFDVTIGNGTSVKWSKR